MGSRVEILNDGGYRSDGRRQYELRDIKIHQPGQGFADGSAQLSHGLTQVQVSVFGPREARLRSQTLYDRANINVEVTILAFSTGERRRRGRGDRRVLEMASTIKSSFEPVIQATLYPRSQIDIFVHVLQQDGGVLQACINATTVALVNAGIPLHDFVCAVSGGVHSASPLLDLTNLEENDLPNITIAVMPRTGKVTLVTMETRLHVDRLKELVTIACEAAQVIHQEMRSAVRNSASALVTAMGSGIAPLNAGANVVLTEQDDRIQADDDDF